MALTERNVNSRIPRTANCSGHSARGVSPAYLILGDDENASPPPRKVTSLAIESAAASHASYTKSATLSAPAHPTTPTAATTCRRSQLPRFSRSSARPYSTSARPLGRPASTLARPPTASSRPPSALAKHPRVPVRPYSTPSNPRDSAVWFKTSPTLLTPPMSTVRPLTIRKTSPDSLNDHMQDDTNEGASPSPPLASRPPTPLLFARSASGDRREDDEEEAHVPAVPFSSSRLPRPSALPVRKDSLANSRAYTPSPRSYSTPRPVSVSEVASITSTASKHTASQIPERRAVPPKVVDISRSTPTPTLIRGRVDAFERGRPVENKVGRAPPAVRPLPTITSESVLPTDPSFGDDQASARRHTLPDLQPTNTRSKSKSRKVIDKMSNFMNRKRDQPKPLQISEPFDFIHHGVDKDSPFAPYIPADAADYNHLAKNKKPLPVMPPPAAETMPLPAMPPPAETMPLPTAATAAAPAPSVPRTRTRPHTQPEVLPRVDANLMTASKHLQSAARRDPSAQNKLSMLSLAKAFEDTCIHLKETETAVERANGAASRAGMEALIAREYALKICHIAVKRGIPIRDVDENGELVGDENET